MKRFNLIALIAIAVAASACRVSVSESGGPVASSSSSSGGPPTYAQVVIAFDDAGGIRSAGVNGDNTLTEVNTDTLGGPNGIELEVDSDRGCIYGSMDNNNITVWGYDNTGALNFVENENVGAVIKDIQIAQPGVPVLHVAHAGGLTYYTLTPNCSGITFLKTEAPIWDAFQRVGQRLVSFSAGAGDISTWDVDGSGNITTTGSPDLAGLGAVDPGLMLFDGADSSAVIVIRAGNQIDHYGGAWPGGIGNVGTQVAATTITDITFDATMAQFILGNGVGAGVEIWDNDGIGAITFFGNGAASAKRLIVSPTDPTMYLFGDSTSSLQTANGALSPQFNVSNGVGVTDIAVGL